MALIAINFPLGAGFTVSQVVFWNVAFDSNTHFSPLVSATPTVCSKVYCTLLCLCICSSLLVFEAGCLFKAESSHCFI